MIQKTYYDSSDQDSTAHPQRILSTEEGTSTGRWQNVPHPLVPNTSFHILDLMARMSATGHRGQVHVRSFSTEPSALTRLQGQLAELAKLERDWNGYGAEAPSERAQMAATETLNILNDLDFLPSRIVASADGGISLVFLLSGGGYADIECFNEGDILAGFQLPGHPPEVEAVILDRDSLSDLSKRIRQLYA